MSSVRVIRATARVSDFLFRNVPPVYVALYDRYKRATEGDEIALIAQCVRPGNRVVDVGANVGFYSAHLARCVGPTGTVYAFEPGAENFARLLARARVYRQIHPVRAAVTDRDGTTDLHLSPDLNVDHRTYATDEQRQKVTVDAISLDSFLRRGEVVDFIKMDIQGGEYAALLGMRDVVARSPTVRILMELWPFVHERFGAGTRTLLSLLESYGFVVRRMGSPDPGRRLSPDSPLPERDDPNHYFNVLCARPETLPD